jgi:hypothetical protein
VLDLQEFSREEGSIKGKPVLFLAVLSGAFPEGIDSMRVTSRRPSAFYPLDSFAVAYRRDSD